jgi:hypothetical protein
MAQGMAKWQAFVNTLMNSTKFGKLLEQLKKKASQGLSTLVSAIMNLRVPKNAGNFLTS